jgi:hypothetical protein
MLEDYFEEEKEEEEQQEASAEVAITMVSEINPMLCVCVLFVVKERAQCTSVPHVTWTYAWCLVSRKSHKSEFVIYRPL